MGKQIVPAANSTNTEGIKNNEQVQNNCSEVLALTAQFSYRTCHRILLMLKTYMSP